MAAAATQDPSTGLSLIEFALAGYRFADQRWRLHAACAGVDPEVLLPTKGVPHDEPLSYCRRCEVRCECLDAALDLGSQAHGDWGGTSGQQRTAARRAGWSAAQLLERLESVSADNS